MDRLYLAAYIAGQFAPLITAAGIVAVIDDVTSYGPALDSVMRQLGLAVFTDDGNPTILAGTEGDAVLLTRYYALEWLQQQLAVQVDIATLDEKEAASQRFKQVTVLLSQARDKVPSQYNIEPGDLAFGRLQLDIFEPWQAGTNIPLGYL